MSMEIAALRQELQDQKGLTGREHQRLDRIILNLHLLVGYVEGLRHADARMPESLGYQLEPITLLDESAVE